MKFFHGWSTQFTAHEKYNWITERKNLYHAHGKFSAGVAANILFLSLFLSLWFFSLISMKNYFYEINFFCQLCHWDLFKNSLPCSDTIGSPGLWVTTSSNTKGARKQKVNDGLKASPGNGKKSSTGKNEISEIHCVPGTS